MTGGPALADQGLPASSQRAPAHFTAEPEFPPLLSRKKGTCATDRAGPIEPVSLYVMPVPMFDSRSKRGLLKLRNGASRAGPS